MGDNNNEATWEEQEAKSPTTTTDAPAEGASVTGAGEGSALPTEGEKPAEETEVEEGETKVEGEVKAEAEGEKASEESAPKTEVVAVEAAPTETVEEPVDGEKEKDIEVEIAQVPEEPEDPRDHLSVVFIGHVDAGKSTIAGNVLYLTGQVDQRTIEKYQQEAKEKAGSSWYLAFIMDTNEDERAKGKTVEVGRAHFETEKRRFTILDAPGHKNYVPNMIGGASQADVGILVISARKGEFETGFDRGGQTREHTMLAKTLGVHQLVVAINKMDDKTVEWSKERYDEIVGKLVPFFKQSGFRPKDITYLPVSGMGGENIKTPAAAGLCPWYTGAPLLTLLEELPLPKRDAKAPLRIPILDKLKDSGKLIIQGKVESGSIYLGQKVIIMPGKKVGKIISLGTDLKEIRRANPGENVRFTIAGASEDHVRTGFVVCDEANPILAVPQFEAQIAILDLLPHKPIFSPGYQAVFHCHTIVEECTVKLLIHEVDKKTNKPGKKKPKFVKKGGMVVVRIEVSQPVCVETYKSFPQLGRFTLRDEGKTIAVGTVTRLPQARPKTEGA